MIRNSLRKTLLVLLLLHSYNSYAWIATGHALTSHVASKLVTGKTLDRVNELLKIPVNFPVIENTPGVLPTSTVELSETLSNIQSAAPWADSIKHYKWVNNDLNRKLASMHFLKVPLDVATDPSSCNNLNEKDVEKLSLQGDNIIRGIKMSIKTLVANNVIQAQKAIALRFLVHWMGDLHQPFHICNPTIKDTKTGKVLPTFGANLIFFKDPSSIFFEKVTGNDTSTDLTKIYCKELHLSFDAMLGAVNQLSETIDIDGSNHSYSCNGYTLWKDNMDTYINYLDKISKNLPKESDNTQPNIITWANDTRKAGCMVITKKGAFDWSISNELLKDVIGSSSQNNYLIKDGITAYPHFCQDHSDLNDYPIVLLTLKNKDEFISDNTKILMVQISKGGQRLGGILNAIFDPDNADSKYVNLVKEINNDPRITVLDLGNSLK